MFKMLKTGFIKLNMFLKLIFNLDNTGKLYFLFLKPDDFMYSINI
ncbi:hypothetical protein LEP1GSC099_1042 [Leptospira interrogans str. UI 08452]|nr:hypothetical protein LEP1GSC099_1042 [Leptospira interrogans str. UI 08452]